MTANAGPHAAKRRTKRTACAASADLTRSMRARSPANRPSAMPTASTSTMLGHQGQRKPAKSRTASACRG